METILLEKIPVTPAGVFIKIKCDKELNHNNSVFLPKEFVGRINKKTNKFIGNVGKISNKYIIKSKINEYWIAYPYVISGNKATEIVKEIPEGTKIIVR
jgi:hypothetical protein